MRDVVELDMTNRNYSSGTVVNISFAKSEHGRKAGEPGAILSMSPFSIASLMTLGGLPSTWHPTLYAVPRISLTVPLRSFEKDLKRMVRAISIISSKLTDLLCLMFFSFFRSRGGSFKALMMSVEAVGTTET